MTPLPSVEFRPIHLYSCKPESPQRVQEERNIGYYYNSFGLFSTSFYCHNLSYISKVL